MWADGLGDSQGQVDDDDDGQVAGDLHHGTGVQIGWGTAGTCCGSGSGGR